ncbi:hypothetical protein CSOJ01_06683 [Colletotrichum sojae]|uniref:Uncharacterized protein n=1 Tax=Colletotrichum sojae TaxID=2175907 RepID=A0A8H6MUW2_9PEZI|nr:hypothetical protein CSOJ01_06683 [Colletotrichum sojae]
MAPITGSQARRTIEAEAPKCHFAVPREILFMIAEQLPPAFYVALAMASKSTFNSLCPTGKFAKMDKENRLSLLALFEKNYPKSFLCFGCGRLKPLNRDGEVRPHFPLDDHSPFDSNQSLKLRSLQPGQHEPPETVWRFTHETSARVINDELILRRSHDVIGPPFTSESQFAHVIKALELPVCRHILCASSVPRGSIRLGPVGPHWRQIISMPELGNTAALWSEPRPIRSGISVASCACCDTDYEIDIKKGNKGGEWKMKLTTYHKLGSFRTPDDDAWMGLTNSQNDTDLLRYRKETVAGKIM